LVVVDIEHTLCIAVAIAIAIAVAVAVAAKCMYMTPFGNAEHRRTPNRSNELIQME